MRKLTAIEFTTVDGVMQGLGSPEEDTDGGFTLGGWGAPYADAIFAESASSELPETTAYLFGRRTFEKMAAYWPFQSEANPIAAHLNATPKYVASRTITSAPWGEGTAHLIGDDLTSEVRDLKRLGEGSIAILGSGVLVDVLLKQDLIDEFRLFIHPLLLGTGKRLFRELPAPPHLELLTSGTSSKGSLMLTYSVSR